MATKRKSQLTDEQRAAIKAAIARSQDPLNNYHPGETQRKFLDSSAVFKAIGGGNRTGKSFHLSWELSALMRDKHPHIPNVRNRKFLLACPTRLQGAKVWGRYLLEDSCLKGFEGQPFVPPSEVTVEWDRTAKPPAPRRIIHNPTGNELLLVWSGYAGLKAMLEGVALDGAALDESAGNQDLIDELMMRTAEARSDEDKPGLGFIWWGFTETSVNMAATNFLNKCRDERLEDYEEFRIQPHENPAVSMEERERTGKGMSKRARDIRVTGTGSALGNVLVFPDATKNIKSLTLDNPYRPDDDDNIWIGLDPGVDHPCGLVFAHINRKHPHRIIVTSAHGRSGEGPNEVVDHIKRYLHGRKIAGFAFDPCGGKRREWGTGKSAIQQVADLMPEDCWAHPAGIAQFFQPNPKHYHGIMTMRRYMHLDQDGGPKLFFDKPTDDNGIDRLISQICEYRGREDKNFEGPHGLVRINDDILDALRYLVVMEPGWIDYGLNRPASPIMGACRPLPKDGEEDSEEGAVSTPSRQRRSVLRDRIRKQSRRYRGHPRILRM